VVADRTERRKILLISQYIQMASAGALTLLVILGVMQVWQILCLSFVSQVSRSLRGPAYQALIPTLVDRERYAMRLL
jgi:Na+/melibiose symporter-like transporter